MTAAESMQVLRNAGAILEGHFRYTSGRHGPIYVEKFRLLEDPRATAELCGQIADRFREAGAEIVVGPTTGGILVAYETARQLGVRNFFAEKAEGGSGRVLRRGFTFQPGQRTLIVDDVLTTGGSIRETVNAVRAAGGGPVGVGVVVDRTAGRTDLGLPFFACLTLDIETYAADACPLCREGIPLEET